MTGAIEMTVDFVASGALAEVVYCPSSGSAVLADAPVIRSTSTDMATDNAPAGGCAALTAGPTGWAAACVVMLGLRRRRRS